MRLKLLACALGALLISGASEFVFAQHQGASDKRDRAVRRSDQLVDPPSRRPQPDGASLRFNERREYSDFDWRRFDRRPRWSQDRFPRFYYDRLTFGRARYRGYSFGPHYRLWYRYAGSWIVFYWPYPYEPSRGCSTYFVPTRRILYTDPAIREEFWDYTDYRRLYLCFD